MCKQQIPYQKVLEVYKAEIVQNIGDLLSPRRLNRPKRLDILHTISGARVLALSPAVSRRFDAALQGKMPLITRGITFGGKVPHSERFLIAAVSAHAGEVSGIVSYFVHSICRSGRLKCDDTLSCICRVAFA